MSASVGRWAEPAPGRWTGRFVPWLAVTCGVLALAGRAAGAPMLPVGLFGAVAVGSALVLYPAVGALLFFAAAWMNAPVVLTRESGNPWLAGALASGLLLVPAFVQAVVLRRGVVVDRPFLLMLLFLGAVLLSTLGARDHDVALAWVGTYAAEGLLLYFLVVNAVRDATLLRRALWMLLVVSATMGAFSIYQEVTRDYEQSFAGFAGRKIERGIDDVALDSTGLIRERERVRPEDRACGPLDDPNHFAQILLVVFPLGLMLGWSARGAIARATAFALSALVLGGVLLTYSRGGFLVLVVILMLLVALRYVRVRHLLVGAAALTALVIAVAPGYLDRMNSIRKVSDMDRVGDQAVRGRVTEMLAAWNVFLDYPVIGVGPGQYTPFYSLDYMDDPGVAYRQIGKERRAHTLYFELGAETGALGLGIFLGLAGLVLLRLRDLRARFAARPGIAHVATGLGLALLAYLGTSVFLSLAFMRYWWLLVALAGVAVRVSGTHEETDRQAAERAVLREAAG